MLNPPYIADICPISANGIPAATSRALEYGNRVFLESIRFDRIGAQGRRGVATLHSVDAHYYGQLDRWSKSAERLRDYGLLSAEDAERIALMDAFGGLIANTDRHFGNITADAVRTRGGTTHRA